MLRMATDADIPHLIEAMIHLKAETGWCNEPGAYNHDTLRLFLTKQLHDPLSVCYVWQADDDLPTAFCGVSFARMFVPPYLPYVHEWGWSGPTRHAVSCWRACTQWAKKRGAVYGYRITASSVMHPRRIEEHVTWERL